MRLTNEQMVPLLVNGKIKRFQEKLKNRDITFDDCGLNADKNFLHSESNVLISDPDELKGYCMSLCAENPNRKCAVFLIENDLSVACEVKFDFNDFDYFDLGEGWHCWNFVSLEEEFDLPSYAILCEINRGEWMTLEN